MNVTWYGCLALVLCTCVAVSARKRYDGYKMVQVDIPVQKQSRVMSILQNKPFTVDFWAEPNPVTTSGQFHVSPAQYEDTKNFLEKNNIKYKLVIDDIQMLLEEDYTDDYESEDPTIQRWTDYHDYDNIMAWVASKANECAGNRCSNFTIGTSHEGRELRVIKIGTPGPSKRRIWIDGGIHAREWIAHSVAQYFIERLIDDYDSDAEVKTLLDTFDFYIEPVVNPDGYVFSWEEDRLWRKSRQNHDPENDPDCIGTDVNRNFDHNFGGVGTSDDPCSQIYCGPRAYSEPEAKAIADFIMRPEVERYRMFMTLHSYSQLWMAPWGYTQDPPPDYDELMRVANLACDALTAFNGTIYTAGSASEILYQSSGTSRDWAKGVPQVPYVYTIELRPARGDSAGFVLPREQIYPTVQETWLGLKAALNAIKDRP